MLLLNSLGAEKATPPQEHAPDGPTHPVSSLIHEGWKLKVWTSYPPEKFKADHILPPQPTAERLQLRAARGEIEPFILVLRSEVPLREVSVRLSELAGPRESRIAAPAQPARHLDYIFVDEPSGSRMNTLMPFTTGTGLFPDPLLSGPAAARPARNLQFWVPVEVPREALPGIYRGEVQVTWRREGWMPDSLQIPVRIPVDITVRSFALPSPSPLWNTAYFSPSQLPADSFKLDWLRPFYADFAAHRHTPEPLLPSPKLRVTPGPALEVDFRAWEDQAAHLLEEVGVPHVFLPVWGSTKERMQGLYFLWHFPAVCGQRWPAFPLPGEPGAFVCGEDGELTPEFRALFSDYLRAANAIVERRKWTGRVLLATMDEPYTVHLSGAARVRDTPAANHTVIRSFTKLVREKAPALRTFCTSNPVGELEESIDFWCLRNFDDLEKTRAVGHKPGGGLLVCDNYRTFIDYPMVSARTLGWLCWRMGARGWLTFETLGDLSTAWSGPAFVYPQFRGGTVWGMGQLFYPNPLGGPLIPSVRWEMLRKGAEDFEHLWLLERLLDGLSEQERTQEPARAARAFLKEAAAQVAGGASDRETAAKNARSVNAQWQQVPHALREQAADWIEKLSPR